MKTISHLWTSYDIAKLLGVNASSVNKWHKTGKLKGFCTPGGHRRFKTEAVVEFVRMTQWDLSALSLEKEDVRHLTLGAALTEINLCQ
jgi:excisionase family DNA binding protein